MYICYFRNTLRGKCLVSRFVSSMYVLLITFRCPWELGLLLPPNWRCLSCWQAVPTDKIKTKQAQSAKLASALLSCRLILRFVAVLLLPLRRANMHNAVQTNWVVTWVHWPEEFQLWALGHGSSQGQAEHFWPICAAGGLSCCDTCGARGWLTSALTGKSNWELSDDSMCSLCCWRASGHRTHHKHSMQIDLHLAAIRLPLIQLILTLW